jgi:uncharacterized protein (UPF0335 family)
MAKKKSITQYNVAEMQPTELNELKRLVKEFVSRIQNVDNEIELLKEDRKAVIEDYSDKLDIKTLNAVLRILKIQQGVDHKDTFDMFMSALENETEL